VTDQIVKNGATLSQDLFWLAFWLYECQVAWMHDDTDFGTVVSERSWVPAPRYLMRRDRILRWLHGHEPGELLEIGPGSGALLRDLSRRNWKCTGLDLAADALDLAMYVTRDDPEVVLSSNPEDILGKQYDYVIACEVLEHIENDHEVFHDWACHLKPGGGLILSVPAHMSKWDATDEWAGHYRRYEREELLTLARENNLKVEKLECYGFPLARLTTGFRARHLASGKAESEDADEMAARTAQSGINRDFELRHYRRQSSWFGRVALKAGIQMQRLFLNTEWGNGYLLLARKR